MYPHESDREGRGRLGCSCSFSQRACVYRDAEASVSWDALASRPVGTVPSCAHRDTPRVRRAGEVAIFPLFAGGPISAAGAIMSHTAASSLAILMVVATVHCSASPVNQPGSGADGSSSAASGSSAFGTTTAAGVNSSSGGTGTCTAVLPSEYDQSCNVDSDCVLVPEATCPPGQGCSYCATNAINAAGHARYMAAYAAASMQNPVTENCSCPCSNVVLCRSGQCQPGPCTAPTADTLSACSSASGMCQYSQTTTCTKAGPANSCAYSDEICCLP